MAWWLSTRREQLTFAVDDSQPVSSNVEVSEGVHSTDVRERGHNEVLPRGVCLLAYFRLVLECKQAGDETRFTRGWSSLRRDTIRTEARLFKRNSPTDRKVSPLRADLEQPKPPDLVEASIEELRVVIGSETLSAIHD